MIVDPLNYDKTKAFEEAKILVMKFLDENDLDHPSEIRDVSGLSVARSGNLRTDYGFYETSIERVNVNLKKSRSPTKVPGFQWSYTGYKADLTCPGILAHEIGHHVHTMLGFTYGRKHVKDLVFVYDSSGVSNETNVSSYEPNPFETFAEAMRMFILNPTLLSEGRQRRYQMFTERFNLVPVVTIHWRDVLVNAHPKIITAAEAWIKKGNLKS